MTLIFPAGMLQQMAFETRRWMEYKNKLNIAGDMIHIENPVLLHRSSAFSPTVNTLSTITCIEKAIVCTASFWHNKGVGRGTAIPTNPPTNMVSEHG